MTVADPLTTERLSDIRSCLVGPAALEILRRELASMLPDGHVLGPLTLRRSKFKPGRKLTAYYTVELGPGGGRLRDIAVIRAADGADRIPAQRDRLEAIEAEAAERGLMEPFRALEARAPAERLRLLVWPLDPTFPHLVRLSDPTAVGRLLPIAGRPSVTALRYRPGQRQVLRYSVPRATFFAKLHQDGDEVRAARRERALTEWLEGGEIPVATVRPLDGIGEPGALFYPHVGGVPVLRELGRLHAAGAALRMLHRAPHSVVEAQQPSRLADEVRLVARASEHIDVLLPTAADRIRGLLARAQDMYARLPQEQPAVVHGDLKLDHLWWTSGRIALIDLTRCRLADPALDIGKLLADLQWWSEQTGAFEVGSAGRRFLDGYFGDAKSPRRLRAGIFEAVLLAKIAARRVPLHDPHWPARIDSLVTSAESVLAAAQRDFRRARRTRPRPRAVLV